MTTRRSTMVVSLVAALFLAGALRAEAASASGDEESNEDLAKKTQNPVAVASSGDQWTVPLGAGGGRLFRLKQLPGGDNLGKLGELPVNTQLQAFYNVIRPDDAATWQLRVQVQFLFPK